MNTEMIQVVWKIRCVNSQTKELFDRFLLLDNPRLSEDELNTIVGMVEKSPADRNIVKYRDYFKEVKLNEISSENKDIIQYYTAFLEDYFEDENGEGMDEIGIIRCLSGQDSPVILGNVRSVLQLGPSSLRNKGRWEQKHSDTLAHFLQVHGQIANSSWLKEKCNLKIIGDNIESEVPSLEQLIYVSVYFRQLYSERDRLFKDACDTYMNFVENEAKQQWVMYEKKCFLGGLNGPPMFPPGGKVSSKEIIEVFLYGALIIHSNKSNREADKEKRRFFKKLLGEWGKEKLVFSLNGCLKQLYNHVATVAPVIYQDLAYWQRTEKIPAPDIQWHKRVFCC